MIIDSPDPPSRGSAASPPEGFEGRAENHPNRARLDSEIHQGVSGILVWRGLALIVRGAKTVIRSTKLIARSEGRVSHAR